MPCIVLISLSEKSIHLPTIHLISGSVPNAIQWSFNFSPSTAAWLWAICLKNTFAEINKFLGVRLARNSIDFDFNVHLPTTSKSLSSLKSGCLQVYVPASSSFGFEIINVWSMLLMWKRPVSEVSEPTSMPFRNLKLINRNYN